MTEARGKDRFAVVRGGEAGTRQLRPGEALRIGRHHENDLVLRDSVVSRFHATLRWDQDAERPVLYDNGSQNGTNVNGRDVIGRAESLPAGASRITVGPYALTIDVHATDERSPVPALIEDAPDSVALFSEQGPEVKGSLDEPDAMRQLFLRLECERRTGTLALDLAGGKAQVTFGAGRIMDASFQGLIGLRALDRVAQATHGAYRFTREMEPSDQAMNLWFSDFLRMKHDSYYATRQWKRPKELGGE
ncbi:MAG: FHA domain-containing protein [Planctomycetes bacterium]|nr:FHA domain-containing protein [Planctomycetota bacterium]